jgi:hypothetical protein
VKPPAPFARERAALDRGVLLALLGPVLWVSGASSAGCGGSDDSSADAAVEASADAGAEAAEQCPGTAGATLGARCASEGLMCAPEYSCSLVQTPLECACTRGVFVCVDVTGAVVPEGGTPGCPPPTDAGCPADEQSANGAACGDVGLSCEYPSACGAGADSCLCTPAGIIGAGPSFVFECSPAACGTSNDGSPAVTDAAASSDASEAAMDGGPGAPLDATVDVVADAAAAVDATLE